MSKFQSIEAVAIALEAGVSVLGENYADELCAKAEALPDATWHYLGAIQRKKVRKLAPHVACFQSLSRVEEAAAIAAVKPGSSVLVQVDTTGDPNRNGVAPAAVPAFLEALGGVDVVVDGFMCVAPIERAAAAACFDTVARLADEAGLAVRSMGMTDDLELAVAAGSTMVRIGTALFGPRHPR